MNSITIVSQIKIATCNLYACRNFVLSATPKRKKKMGKITLLTYYGRMSHWERHQIKCKTYFHYCTSSNWLLFVRVGFYMYLLSIWFCFGGHTIVKKFPRSCPPSQCTEFFNIISQESRMLFWILRDRWTWIINIFCTFNKILYTAQCPHFWTPKKLTTPQWTGWRKHKYTIFLYKSVERLVKTPSAVVVLASLPFWRRQLDKTFSAASPFGKSDFTT